MGIISKRARVPELPPIDPAHWIGRKFRTDRAPDESIVCFSEARDECYAVAAPEPVGWVVPPSAATYASTQGRATTEPPTRVLSYKLVGGGRITLALWSGMVTSGAAGSGGPPYEMWFVPSGFDQSPIPISGRWKMRDPSLASIGWVESPQWGASFTQPGSTA